jgi:hypothetical protein
VSHPDSLIETAGARARAQLEVYLRWWSMNKNSWRFATRPAVNFDLQKDAQKCLIIRGWLFDDRIARLTFFFQVYNFSFFFWGVLPVGGHVSASRVCQHHPQAWSVYARWMPLDSPENHQKIPLSNWCDPAWLWLLHSRGLLKTHRKFDGLPNLIACWIFPWQTGNVITRCDH